ncbi:hypothetical protein ACS0TY_012915 [Phlomoides rotata]
MSQQQPERPSVPIKYGDFFNVSGELASEPVAPQDAAILQAAEAAVLGNTPKGAPAALVKSAADLNEQRGVVGHDDMTAVVRDRGVTITEAEVCGYRMITESIGGQVIGQFGEQVGEKMTDLTSAAGPDTVTVGEALEATALSAGDKAVDEGDAAAIQAAEIRATGLGHVVPGGVGAEAQSAAAYNRTTEDESKKTKLEDVLTDATEKLTSDKPLTLEDAEGVIYAEIRNREDLVPHVGGVAAAMAAGARSNLEK